MNRAAELGRRFYVDILSTGNWDSASEILSENLVMHHPASPLPIKGLAAVKELLGAVHAGLPGTFTLQDVFGVNDRATFRWEMTATHTGELFGLPPTGRTITVNGISIIREEGGLIVEDWVTEDTAGMMRQLGAS